MFPIKTLATISLTFTSLVPQLAFGYGDGSNTTIRACYTVPVSGDLRDVAEFPVEHGFIRREGDKITIGYELHKDFVGPQDVHVVLTGTVTAEKAPFVDVTDPATGARGHCLLSAGNLMCMLQYTDISFDWSKTSARLTTEYANDSKLAQRLEVARVFEHNAVGILHAELPQD